MISSECYIVSWIITLYSATYQYSMESYLVDYLWDKFVVWGWREFFKFTLWVFNLYKVIGLLFRMSYLSCHLIKHCTFWENSQRVICLILTRRD